MLDGLGPLRVAPRHPGAAGSGTHVALTCPDEATAALVLEAVAVDGVDASIGIGYGHSFPEWDVLHARRGGHVPSRNALLDSPWRQGPGACPRSRDVLSRTVLLRYGLDLPERAVAELHDQLAPVAA
jgi:hypothetical protein